LTAVREDGRLTSFPLQRIGRVFAPTFSTRTDKLELAFDEIHDRGDKLVLAEPRLRDAQSGEENSIRLINDLIDSLSTTDAGADHQTREEALWSLQNEAAAIEGTERQIERLHNDIWEPFDRCARVLDHFGYLDFAAERVTERGKWLADLR